MHKILLADNGSKQPAATIMLRSIAARLSTRCGIQVDPVSLQHADSIETARLDDVPANVLPSWLRNQLEAGERHFILLPLFFGKSRALTSFIPEQKAILEKDYGPFEIKFARELYPMPDADAGLSEILLAQIERSVASLQDNSGRAAQAVVLVDHGTPLAKVNEVRRSLASALAPNLQLPLDQACMERRPGAEYDFNGELLEDWLLRQAQQGLRGIVVSMLFLLPGRHAGEGGDVAEICQGVIDQFPDLRIEISPLVGESEGLIELLQQRLKEVLPA